MTKERLNEIKLLLQDTHPPLMDVIWAAEDLLLAVEFFLMKEEEKKD